MNNNIIATIIMFAFTFGVYNVGQEISINDQQWGLDVCNGHEPNGEIDDEMSLYDYNGEYNGGRYYVTHIDMAASW